MGVVCYGRHVSAQQHIRSGKLQDRKCLLRFPNLSQGLHVLIGAKYLNTMTNGSMCTVGFTAIMAVISWVCSLPRTFNTLSKLGTVSAIFTFVSVLLAAVFAGIEDHPKGYNTGGPKGLSWASPRFLSLQPQEPRSLLA